MKQLTLFEEARHLESDYFLSGVPEIPDPYYGDQWVYDNYIFDHPKLFNGELDYNNNYLPNDVGKIALRGCDEI